MKMRIFRKYLEKPAILLFFLCALTAVMSLGLIAVYILMTGFPAIRATGLAAFLFGTQWQPGAEIFGILPMIIASLAVTFGAILIGIPMGLLTAAYLAKVAPAWISRILRPMIQLLAGIPSVVFGFFGLMVVVPLIDRIWGGGGNSLLAAVLILSVMILPTIVSLSETAIRAVPGEYNEGSLALGASDMQTLFRVTIPAARSGILAGIVLGMGRAIGETMAVILVAGNTVQIPDSLLDRVRTLTANCAIEMGYAFGLHRQALFATGIILFVFILLLNLAAACLVKRFSGSVGGAGGK